MAGVGTNSADGVRGRLVKGICVQLRQRAYVV